MVAKKEKRRKRGEAKWVKGSWRQALSYEMNIRRIKGTTWGI